MWRSENMMNHITRSRGNHLTTSPHHTDLIDLMLLYRSGGLNVTDPPLTPPRVSSSHSNSSTPADPPGTPADPSGTPADSLGSLGTSQTPEPPSLITSQTDIKDAARILLKNIVSFVQYQPPPIAINQRGAVDEEPESRQIRTPRSFKSNDGKLIGELFDKLLLNFEHNEILREEAFRREPLEPYPSSKSSVVFPLSIGNKVMVIKYTSDNLQTEYELLEQLDATYLVKLLTNPGYVEFANFYPARFYIGIYPRSETMNDFCSRYGGRPEEEKEAILRSFMAGLFTAIHYLHKNNIVHRDIKPGNLGFESIGENQVVVKLMDFGMSSTLASAGGVEGSVGYMSPAMIQWMRGNSPENTDQYDPTFMNIRHQLASAKPNAHEYMYKAQDLFAASLSMAFVIYYFSLETKTSPTDVASTKRRKAETILQQSFELGSKTFLTPTDIEAFDKVTNQINIINHIGQTLSLVVSPRLQKQLTILIQNQED